MAATTPSATSAPPTPSPCRILSIQSHVTSGYVGNKAAVPPLHLLGHHVDVLNSCMLANHTGYHHGAPGLRLSGPDLRAQTAGLAANGLLAAVTHVLTGYIGTASFLEAVADTVADLRVARPALVYVCDPVLGDNGKLYVPEALVDVYRARVLPCATILTPNAFELGLLARRDIHSEAAAFDACDLLHEQYGVRTIFVTGMRPAPDSADVSVLISSRAPDDTAAPQRHAVDATALDGKFTGSGDLLAALLLAWMHRLQGDAVAACERAMASVSAVLRRTLHMPKQPGLCKLPELRLIESQPDILSPPVELVRRRVVVRPDANGDASR